MSYDHNFDTIRLNQLADQYLTDNNAKGRVIFFSESDDNSLDYATWSFPDGGDETLRKGGFKVDLMELLRILLMYRAQQNQVNASQGVVLIDGSTISVQWLTKDAAEQIRNSVYEKSE